MDPTKKRKTEENGDLSTASPPSSAAATLTPDDFRQLLQPMPHDHLVEILQSAAVRHPDAFLHSLRHVTDPDVSPWPLRRHRSVFSGELDDAVAIFDKGTGKSKGYGFVTFKHADEALIALKEPSKKIDGRVTVTQYASAGHSASFGGDVSARKIYVGMVPFEISSERLLAAFAEFGEIEEGPLGFDINKSTAAGKSKGFAFFVYKTEEGARAALAEPTESIDGHIVMCKLAVDNKKIKHDIVDNSGVAPPPFRPQQLQQEQYPGFLGDTSHRGTITVSVSTAHLRRNSCLQLRGLVCLGRSIIRLPQC